MIRNSSPSLLTARQRRGLVALMAAPTIREAARISGITERTLYRWLSQPAFSAALMAAEAQALEGATRRLTVLLNAAVDALQRILSDKTIPTAVQLRAAEMVLVQGVRLRELRDLEQRLSALEVAWESRDKSGKI